MWPFCCIKITVRECSKPSVMEISKGFTQFREYLCWFFFSFSLFLLYIGVMWNFIFKNVCTLWCSLAYRQLNNLLFPFKESGHNIDPNRAWSFCLNSLKKKVMGITAETLWGQARVHSDTSFLALSALVGTWSGVSRRQCLLGTSELARAGYRMHTDQCKMKMLGPFSKKQERRCQESY